MLKIKKFTFGPFQENTYLLWDELMRCTIIDPGCSNAREEKELSAFLTDQGLTADQLIYTHCHIDHVLGHAYICDSYDLSPLYHAEEEQVMEMATVTGEMYGVNYTDGPRADKHLSHGDTIQVGDTEMTCLWCPGHSPGSLVFYDGKQLAIGGDVLFRESIGRTDLPGGNHEQLLQSIREQLYTLPDEVYVFPGHGPKTSIGYEKLHNPWVNSQ